MKLPFSYRSASFPPVLLASFAIHFVFVGVGGSFFSGPEFAVRKARTSLEVVLLKETKMRKEKGPSRAQALETPVVSPPLRGAQSEIHPHYLKNPAPLYPRLAREQGWEGLVILKALVERNGKPFQVQVEKSSGYKILDDSAVQAVKNWHFLPARLGNLAFSSWVRIPIRFILVEEE